MYFQKYLKSESLNNNKALRILFFYNGIFMMAAMMLGPLYAIYVLKYVDGVTAVSTSWAAFLISTSLFTLIISRQGDKIKEKEYLLLASYALRVISWLSLIFVRSLVFLILVQIILGLAESLGTPAFNTIFASHLDKNKYINEYSNWAIIANLTSAAGVIIGGVVVSVYGFTTLFVIMSLLSTVSFFGILFKPRHLL